jgi:hypothetical protein
MTLRGSLRDFAVAVAFYALAVAAIFALPSCATRGPDPRATMTIDDRGCYWWDRAMTQPVTDGGEQFCIQDSASLTSAVGRGLIAAVRP